MFYKELREDHVGTCLDLTHVSTLKLTPKTPETQYYIVVAADSGLAN